MALEELLEAHIKQYAEDYRFRISAENESRLEINQFDIKVSGGLLSQNKKIITEHIGGRDTGREGFFTQLVVDRDSTRTLRTGDVKRRLGDITDKPALRNSQDLDMLLKNGPFTRISYNPEMFKYSYGGSDIEGNDVLYLVLDGGNGVWRFGVLKDDGYRIASFESFDPQTGLQQIAQRFSGYRNTKDGGRYPYQISSSYISEASLPEEIVKRMADGELNIYSREVLDASEVISSEVRDVRLEEVLTQTETPEAHFVLEFPENTEVTDRRGGRSVTYQIDSLTNSLKNDLEVDMTSERFVAAERSGMKSNALNGKDEKSLGQEGGSNSQSKRGRLGLKMYASTVACALFLIGFWGWWRRNTK